MNKTPQIKFNDFTGCGWYISMGDTFEDGLLCVGGNIYPNGHNPALAGQPDSYYFLTKEDAERELARYLAKFRPWTNI